MDAGTDVARVGHLRISLLTLDFILLILFYSELLRIFVAGLFDFIVQFVFVCVW